jgi:iron complex outermembrane receptor protein
MLWLCSIGQANEHMTGAGEYFSELPVVLSASRLVQTVDEAPAAVTVIDRRMIRASGARDIVDLFRLVPGMTVGAYKGHRPILGFHGFSETFFRQLQILVDGVSVYSPLWGGGEWNELPLALDDIERIEVVRGPNAATFGANSFLGVVNIITRDPATEQGGAVAANIGENGIRDILVRQTAGEGDWRYRISAGQRSDQGLDSFPDTRRTNFANLRGHLRVSATDELRLQAGYSGGTQDEGIYGRPNQTDGPRTGNFDLGSLQARWTRSLGQGDELWIQFAHAGRSHRETLAYVLDEFRPYYIGNYPLDFAYEHRRTDLEMQHTLRLSEMLRGVWGLQARHDGARSRTYFATHEWLESKLYRVFGHIEWRPSPDWIAFGGAMLESNSMTPTALSPSLALIRHLAPGHSVRLRFAKANRTPTLFEQEVDWKYEAPADLKALIAGPLLNRPDIAALPLKQSRLTRQDLVDERIRSRELSYFGQFPSLGLTADIGLFEYRLDRLLGWERYASNSILSYFVPNRDYTDGYANTDSARVRGQTATLHSRPWKGSSLYLGASRTIIEPGDGPYANLIATSGPVHTVSVLIVQDLPHDWQASVGYYHVGSMRSLGGAVAPLPPTDRVNLRVAKQLRVGTSLLELTAVLLNATGSIPMFEARDLDRRTGWLGIRYQY